MIPVNEPLLNGNEKKYLNECIDTGWISSEGPFISRFEEGMAKRVGRKYGIAVCNGSAALDAAVLALDLPKGTEVIMPSFTIISCALAIVRAGLKPVVVDSDPHTWNMDVNQLQDKITSKTSAIMVVHIYGLPTNMNPVLELAKKHGLKIIEDAAEQHGQDYYGKPIGSFGDISTFSFYPNKHITTGEGGMIMTDDEKLAEKCRSIRNLAFLPRKRFVHEEMGYNFRMTNLQAALGVAQLERLDEFVTKKRHIGSLYRKLLKGIETIELQPEQPAYSKNIYWVFGIVLKDNFPYDAESMMKKLADKKIGTRPFFYPMHQQPVFHKMGLFKNEKLPVSERLAKRGFYVPSGLAIMDKQVEEVAETLKNLLA